MKTLKNTGSRGPDKKKLKVSSRSSERIPSRKKVEVAAENTTHYERVKCYMDRPFLIIVFALVAIGTVMIFSASYANAKAYQHDAYYFIKRQIIWVLVGTVALIITANLDYRIIRKFNKPFLYVSLLLLAVVPLIGKEVKGAKRWIPLGPIQLQPSELVKLAIVIFFANYIVTHTPKDMKTIRYGFVPYILVGGFVAVFMWLQPHLSGLIIILALLFVLMFLGGSNPKLMLLGLVGGVAGVTFIAFFSSHSKARIDAWLHPELYIQSTAFQPMQSLYAIGSGGFWGVGLGQSTQKQLYLPEPQNDYIFAILCEEMGFIFAVAVIGLFLALIWRGFYIAKNAPNKYSSIVATGIIFHVALQALLNIAVVTNSIPATGVSLPFFSYGGTSLILLMAEMGMVLNISRYSYIEKG